MNDPAALAAAEVERLLPCKTEDDGCYGDEHDYLCAVQYRPQVAAALLAAEQRGAERALAAVQKWGEDREEAEVLYCVEQVRAGKD